MYKIRPLVLTVQLSLIIFFACDLTWSDGRLSNASAPVFNEVLARPEAETDAQRAGCSSVSKLD